MRMTVSLVALLVAATAGAAAEAPGPGEARLLRFPTIHGNAVVFTYAGDLYTVPAAGTVYRSPA